MESVEIGSLDPETTGLWLASILLLLLLFVLHLRNLGWQKRLNKVEVQSSRDAKLERLLKLVEQNAGKERMSSNSRPVKTPKKVPLARSIRIDKSIIAGRRQTSRPTDRQRRA